VVILGVGTGSETGDYGATPLGDVGTFQVGLFAGSGELGYGIPVPPAAAGPALSLALNYDSGSVAGFAGNKNTQPSWVGLGWQLSSGSIRCNFWPPNKLSWRESHLAKNGAMRSSVPGVTGMSATRFLAFSIPSRQALGKHPRLLAFYSG